MSPSTEQLARALAAALGPLAALQRRPSPSASTAELEDVRVELVDGSVHELVLKSGGRDTLRELAVYREVLSGTGLGPRLVAGSRACGGWLVVEAVRGAPLWQSGELSAWCATARELARAHVLLADLAAGLPEVVGSRYDEQLTAAQRRDPRAGALSAVHAAAVAALAAAPLTVVHGELFPSNVVLDRHGRPCVVDWETAGRGPGLLDLAALTLGWQPDAVAAVASSYGGDLALLAPARLVVAVRWLGEAPALPGAGGGHAARTDWWAEASAAAEALG